MVVLAKEMVLPKVGTDVGCHLCMRVRFGNAADEASGPEHVHLDEYQVPCVLQGQRNITFQWQYARGDLDASNSGKSQKEFRLGLDTLVS